MLKRQRYVPGTVVQRANGTYYVKTKEGMKPLARRVYELKHGDLTEGWRVFHINGRKDNNELRNLQPIYFNPTRYKFEWKLVYVPEYKKERVKA